mmetsp:Transcript_118456/g.368928  ORF Transcript_118456/g.368928 Transcript_118456/m.368928 type:complete len:262 (+) Transcript_118456:271-1056(+)
MSPLPEWLRQIGGPAAPPLDGEAAPAAAAEYPAGGPLLASPLSSSTVGSGSPGRLGASASSSGGGRNGGRLRRAGGCATTPEPSDAGGALPGALLRRSPAPRSPSMAALSVPAGARAGCHCAGHASGSPQRRAARAAGLWIASGASASGALSSELPASASSSSSAAGAGRARGPASSPPPTKSVRGQGTRKSAAPVSCRPVTQAGTGFAPSSLSSVSQKCMQLQWIRSYLPLGQFGESSHLIRFHTSQSCKCVVPRFTDCL